MTKIYVFGPKEQKDSKKATPTYNQALVATLSAHSEDSKEKIQEVVMRDHEESKER